MSNDRIGAIAVLFDGKIFSWKAGLNYTEESIEYLGDRYFDPFKRQDAEIKYAEFSGPDKWGMCDEWFAQFPLHPQHPGESAPRERRPRKERCILPFHSCPSCAELRAERQCSDDALAVALRDVERLNMELIAQSATVIKLRAELESEVERMRRNLAKAMDRALTAEAKSRRLQQQLTEGDQ
jgi:hypothetical protein